MSQSESESRDRIDAAQTSFVAEWHADQQRLDDVESDGGTAESRHTCVADDASCPGISGMYFGQFPCVQCWLHAPPAAHQYFRVWLDGDARCL